MLCSYQTKVVAIPFCKSDTFKRCNDAVIVPLLPPPLLFCHDTPWGAIQSFNLLLGGPMGGLMLFCCCCCIYLALFIPLGMTKQFVFGVKGFIGGGRNRSIHFPITDTCSYFIIQNRRTCELTIRVNNRVLSSAASNDRIKNQKIIMRATRTHFCHPHPI